jgi:AbrB family looped-hinge helix DNA binding protein
MAGRVRAVLRLRRRNALFLLDKMNIMKGLPAVTTMSSRGQIVIPKRIREALHLAEGERFDIHIEGKRLVLVSQTRSYNDWRSLRGAFGPTVEPVQNITARKSKTGTVCRGKSF